METKIHSKIQISEKMDLKLYYSEDLPQIDHCKGYIIDKGCYNNNGQYISFLLCLILLPGQDNGICVKIDYLRHEDQFDFNGRPLISLKEGGKEVLANIPTYISERKLLLFTRKIGVSRSGETFIKWRISNRL